MNYKFISKDENIKNKDHRLVILFAGWGMDWRPFNGLKRNGYDIAVVWDYLAEDIENKDFSFKCLKENLRMEHYNEICIFAWSMGVSVASYFLNHFGRKLTLAVAINGTCTPVDNENGIPCNIYEATLNGLSPQSLRKFYARMCGSFRRLELLDVPKRDFESLRTELELMKSLKGNPFTLDLWDTAIISKEDAIFPPDNMRFYWKKTKTQIFEISSPHYPDFQVLLNNFIREKDLVSNRFSKSIQTYDKNAIAQEAIALHLNELICESLNPERQLGSILEVGSGTGKLTSRIRLLAPEIFELWDLSNPPKDSKTSLKENYIKTDAEIEIGKIKGKKRFDLIASASTIQWFNSPVKFIKRALDVLNSDGILALSTFGPENLYEISQISGVKLPALSSEEWKAVLDDFANEIWIEEDEIKLEFESPLEAFRHLKATGVNSLSSDVPITEILRKYPTDTYGRACLTFKPIYILLKK